MRCLSWDKKSPNRSGREWVRLGLVLPFLLVACSVQASPIASSSIHAASDQRNLSAWEAFLAGGRTYWANVAPPPVTSGIRALMAEDLAMANPAGSPIGAYLIWRRDLDPTRFDLNHPTIGPRLESLNPTTTACVNCTTTTTTPTPTTPQAETTTPGPGPAPGPGTVTTAGTGPGAMPPPGSSPSPGLVTGPVPASGPTPGPPPIPEPSTWLMAVGLLGASLWWRKGSGRGTTAHPA